MKGTDKIRCPCGCGLTLDEKVVKTLDYLDDELVRWTGQELVLLSGARCREYNAKIGGKPNSAHILGIACDVNTSDNKIRYRLLKLLFDLGVKRIFINFQKNFVHFDLADRNTKMPNSDLYYVDNILGSY